MIRVTDYPPLVFAVTFLFLALSIWTGMKMSGTSRKLEEAVREDYGYILTAVLTLLGLIIGFSFSMATSRYDLRKQCEEEEANAIGTEYLRAELLPAADAAKVQGLLRDYLDQRILFYPCRNAEQMRRIDARTSQLQAELWSAAAAPAALNLAPSVALAVSGMNDVLNSQGYSLAAERNRIPAAAWAMMMAIAVCGALLIGYGARSARSNRLLHLTLPLVVAISFFLIADIDSPRGGVIRVQPENLIGIVDSLRAP